MAHSDRDKRGRPRSSKRCPEAANGGCNYCITGTCKRAFRRRQRAAGKKDCRQ